MAALRWAPLQNLYPYLTLKSKKLSPPNFHASISSESVCPSTPSSIRVMSSFTKSSSTQWIRNKSPNWFIRDLNSQSVTRAHIQSWYIQFQDVLETCKFCCNASMSACHHHPSLHSHDRRSSSWPPPTRIYNSHTLLQLASCLRREVVCWWRRCRGGNSVIKSIFWSFGSGIKVEASQVFLLIRTSFEVKPALIRLRPSYSPCYGCPKWHS